LTTDVIVRVIFLERRSNGWRFLLNHSSFIGQRFGSPNSCHECFKGSRPNWSRSGLRMDFFLGGPAPRPPRGSLRSDHWYGGLFWPGRFAPSFDVLPSSPFVCQTSGDHTTGDLQAYEGPSEAKPGGSGRSGGPPPLNA
jgi:hypothetical protein